MIETEQNLKPNEVEKAQREVIDKNPLKGDVYNGWSMSYVDFKKVDQKEIDDEAKDMIQNSLAKGGRYGFMLIEDNTMESDTTMLYPLDSDNMSELADMPDELNKDVANKTSKLSSMLSKKGVKNLGYGVEEGLDYEPFAAAEPDKNSSNQSQQKAYQAYLNQQGLER